MLAGLAAAGTGALVLGFLLFATKASHGPSTPLPKADAIVVLTGADRRIEEGGRLLESGHGQRLLITGVNPQTGRDELKRLMKGHDALFDCCVDIGYLAKDTIGNADETRDWVRRLKYQRVIVVTSSWHMPRSLLELGRTLPGVDFVPYPVVPRALLTEPWWLRTGILRRLVGEYLKLFPAAARYAGSRLLHAARAETPPSQHSTAAAQAR